MIRNGLSQAPAPTLIRPARSLGGLVFDVIVEEGSEDTLSITEHPVEKGAEISDHAIIKPKRLTLRGGVSDAGDNQNGTVRRSTSFYEKLLELQASREPVQIITGRRSYDNMLIETLSVTDNKDTDGSIFVSAECREVQIVSVRTTTMAPRHRHSQPRKTGGVADAGQKQPVKRSGLAELGAGGYQRNGAAQ